MSIIKIEVFIRCAMNDKLLGKCGFYCGACPTYICDTFMTKPHCTVLDKD